MFYLSIFKAAFISLNTFLLLYSILLRCYFILDLTETSHLRFIWKKSTGKIHFLKVIMHDDLS